MHALFLEVLGILPGPQLLKIRTGMCCSIHVNGAAGSIPDASSQAEISEQVRVAFHERLLWQLNRRRVGCVLAQVCWQAAAWLLHVLAHTLREG